jgi:hypothetical protein
MKTKKMTSQDYKERKKLSWEAMFYSVQMMDLLIIFISGAGVYFCLEVLITDFGLICFPSLAVKFNLLIFIIAILLNFIGQYFGHKANYHDYMMCEYGVNDPDDKMVDFHDKESEKHSGRVALLNLWSMIAMFLGLAIGSVGVFIAA